MNPMKYITSLILLIALISCKSHRDKFNYETSIASSTYEAQLRYLDNTLFNYSRISDTGYYYYDLSSKLDKEAAILKKRVRNGAPITIIEQEGFLKKYEKTFGEFPALEIKKFKEVQQIPIRTASDIDIIRVLIKTNFVAILLNNKLLPFDSWGIMASGKNEIKEGEELELTIATYAFKSYPQNEWYLIKEDLSSDNILNKENIIDTLFPDVDGKVYFKTKKYEKGENRLLFLSRLNHPPKDRMISQSFSFYVK